MLQVHVSATSHPEVARGSSTDQAGIGGNSSPEVGVRVSEDGLFFSRLVGNLMPFISQATSTNQDDTRINQSSSTAAAAAMQNSNDSSSSRSRQDPPDAPSPKRARGE